MSSNNGMRPVHPGEILRDELDELGMSAKAFAEALGVPANGISAILKGQRGVTADTALRLARHLGTTPQVWLNLQKAFELRVAQLQSGKEIAKSVKPRAAADRGRFRLPRPRKVESSSPSAKNIPAGTSTSSTRTTRR